MQTTENGEYVPSKELNINFKIPKRKYEQTIDTSVAPFVAPVLDASYYNQPLPPGVPPPVAPIQLPFPSETQKFILENLQKFDAGEKPKTYQNHILKETIPDCFDETLPRELITQFQPLYCKLCAAQLSSNVVAKFHYKSKNHEKRIRRYLIEHAARTGEPPHKRACAATAAAAAPSASGGAADEANPLHFYCDVCDLPLTGRLHAESHYLGKNHRRAILGQKRPAGRGQYDAGGKWVRAAKGGEAVGADFRSREEAVAMAAVAVAQPVGFRCEVCNVTTTCEDQLQSHYLGQKHRKRMKLGVGAEMGGDALGCLGEGVGFLDCSVYRTPSGQFYCQICNSTSNSEATFRQHLQSKTHAKKLMAKK